MTYLYWRIICESEYAYCPRCGRKLSIVSVRESVHYNGVSGQRQSTYIATVACPTRPSWLTRFLQGVIGYSGHYHEESFVAPCKSPGERVLLEAVK